MTTRLAPQRRPEVDAEAVWVAGIDRYGAWVCGEIDPATGAAVGRWQAWRHRPHLDHDEYLETAFEAGLPVLRRQYGAVRWTRLSGRTHRDGFLLEVETRFVDGREVVRHGYDDGVLRTSTEHRDDGTVASVRFHDNGQRDVERVTRDDVLVVEEWFDPSGARLAEVRPVAEPDWTSSGRKVAVGSFTAFDAAGARLAEGKVRAGPGGAPIGRWTLFGTEAGMEPGTVRFKPFKLGRRADLGGIAHTLRRWHYPRCRRNCPVWTVCAGASSGRFGSARYFPLFLKGLTVPDPVAVDLAVNELDHPVLHQGTIHEVSGPAARYIGKALHAVADAELALPPMRLLIMMATREGDLGAANAIKKVCRAVPDGADAGEFLDEHDTEASYHEVFRAIDDATPLWTRWAEHPQSAVRQHAQVLLALAPGDAAAAALRERIATEPDPAARADGLLGLVLHEPGEATRTVLTAHLTGADPLLRFCAALTWIRHRLADGDRAAQTVIDALVDGTGLERFDGLFFSSGSAAADAATTLALLPAEEASRHVAGLADVVDRVDPANAVAVARALLDVVFPTEAYRGRGGVDRGPADRCRRPRGERYGVAVQRQPARGVAVQRVAGRAGRVAGARRGSLALGTADVGGQPGDDRRRGSAGAAAAGWVDPGSSRGRRGSCGPAVPVGFRAGPARRGAGRRADAAV